MGIKKTLHCKMGGSILFSSLVKEGHSENAHMTGGSLCYLEKQEGAQTFSTCAVYSWIPPAHPILKK